MPEIILDQPEIVASIGEVKAARVLQHVRVDGRQLSALRGHGDEVVRGLRVSGCSRFEMDRQGSASVRIPK